MRVIIILFKSLFGIILLLFACFGIWLFTSALGPVIKEHFRIDPSQSYRRVEDYGQILFYDRSSFYRRRFWGLQKVYTNPDYFLPYNGDMVWCGESGDRVYVWVTDYGIQCLDLDDFSVVEILSQEDVMNTGTINENNGFSKARYCKDWNDGAGFTYQLDGTVYKYEYKTKEISSIGKSQGDYALTEQGIYYLETSGEEQKLLRKNSSGNTAEIASNVSAFTAGSQSGRLLYYDRDEQRYHLYNTGTGEDITLPPDISMYSPVISPDGMSILYQKAVLRSGTTDDEDDYYRVLNLVTNEVTTIYGGYRAWLGYVW